jgi:RNA polymerase sigma factor (sigma-70 family)
MSTETETDIHEAAQTNNWVPLVERIRNNDPSAVEELYMVFSKGVRYFLWRQLGHQDLDDRVHDIFLMVVQSIQRGELREPERLMGYVRTVVRRQVAGYIHGAVNARSKQVAIDTGVPLSDYKPDPERRAIESQNTRVAMRILHSLPTRDREVLVRFYLQEQPAEQICHDLKITETQFRLLKSRAKSRYGELGRRRFARRTGFQAFEKSH